MKKNKNTKNCHVSYIPGEGGYVLYTCRRRVRHPVCPFRRFGRPWGFANWIPPERVVETTTGWAESRARSGAADAESRTSSDPVVYVLRYQFAVVPTRCFVISKPYQNNAVLLTFEYFQTKYVTLQRADEWLWFYANAWRDSVRYSFMRAYCIRTYLFIWMDVFAVLRSLNSACII